MGLTTRSSASIHGERQSLLDPAGCVTLVDDVKEHVPGLKTSAAFLSSLRLNLSLHDAPRLPSPSPTPRLNPRASVETLAQHSLPLSGASSIAPATQLHQKQQQHEPEVPSPGKQSTSPCRDGFPPTTPTDAELPEAKTDWANVTVSILPAFSSLAEPCPARAAARSLLTHSLVRDQTLLALRTFVTHPLHLVLLALAFLVTRVLVPASYSTSRLAVLTTCMASSLGMVTALTSIWYPLWSAAAGIAAAEVDDAGAEHELLIARMADKPDGPASVVGFLSLSYRMTQSGPPPPQTKGRTQHRRHGSSSRIHVRGSVRAWTVSPACRGRGVGRQLLQAAAAAVLRKGGDAAELELSPAHVYAHAPEAGPLTAVLGPAGGLYSGLAWRRECWVRAEVRAAVEAAREHRRQQQRANAVQRRGSRSGSSVANGACSRGAKQATA